ncbi:GAF domain-containing protein [Actinopolyspora saharensis]|uniref:GAF domain-containing protein n=1 Tax=Actinopolyspora saharensis TaxID=995062 RepID=A0A1H0YLN7_9ACTN|nr:GAF domain-containing protein [Actinopolyspora saharensis]SDQ16107.1 GAF domain-containing protein [Actinopolyspora saharensis]
MSTQSWRETADSLAYMSRDLLAQDTGERTLERLVEHAREIVDGCEHAGILLVHGNQRVETPAATSDLVVESDRLQGELGEGPCFDAVVHNQSVYRLIDLNQRVTSWPRYAPEARKLGIASMMGLQLYTAADTYAALDVYSSQPQAFTEHAEHVGWLLSSHAAVAVAATRPRSQQHPALQARSDTAERLR